MYEASDTRRHFVKKSTKPRDWTVVFIGSLLILMGLAMVCIAVFFAKELGWWSAIIGIGGLSSVGFATMAIVKNDPSWILIDLLLP